MYDTSTRVGAINQYYLVPRVEVGLRLLSVHYHELTEPRYTVGGMDFIHHQVALVEKQLSFVTTDPIDWKTYVQVFSWGVCLFESYLL